MTEYLRTSWFDSSNLNLIGYGFHAGPKGVRRAVRRFFVATSELTKRDRSAFFTQSAEPARIQGPRVAVHRIEIDVKSALGAVLAATVNGASLFVEQGKCPFWAEADTRISRGTSVIWCGVKSNGFRMSPTKPLENEDWEAVSRGATAPAQKDGAGSSRSLRTRTPIVPAFVYMR